MHGGERLQSRLHLRSSGGSGQAHSGLALEGQGDNPPFLAAKRVQCAPVDAVPTNGLPDCGARADQVTFSWVLVPTATFSRGLYIELVAPAARVTVMGIKGAMVAGLVDTGPGRACTPQPRELSSDTRKSQLAGDAVVVGEGGPPPSGACPSPPMSQ